MEAQPGRAALSDLGLYRGGVGEGMEAVGEQPKKGRYHLSALVSRLEGSEFRWTIAQQESCRRHRQEWSTSGSSQRLARRAKKLCGVE